MKRLLALTLFGLLTLSCYNVPHSKGGTMTYSVATQADLDAANQRISEFKQELLRQGFREVSVSSSNTKEEVVLEGQYGTIKDLRITLSTAQRLEKDHADLAGGVRGSLRDDQADRDFDELYSKVAYVVTGHPHDNRRTR
jgi:hypothetical protein